MPIAFSTSLRALAAEQDRGRLAGLVLVLVLVATWARWLFGAELVITAVSDRARIEVSRAAVPVTTMLAGRVAESRLGLGRRVEAGEVLVVLDTTPLRLEREAQRATLAGLNAQLAASEREHAALVAAIETYRRGGVVRAAEAQAGAREAEVDAALAASQAERSSVLAQQGFAPAELEEAGRAALLGRQAGAAIRRLHVSRTVAEGQERIAALDIDRARLERQQSELRGEVDRREAALTVFDRRLAEHELRAPIAGTLGHAPPLQPGAVLTQHTTVAQIIPDGELRIVASFRAAEIGRIVPGLPVRLRLDGFPWAEFGSLRGAVLHVASEPVAGLIRVECSIDAASGPALPREHGLGGMLEVEVERLAPVALLARNLGLALAAAAPAPWVELKGKRFTVELAADESERAQGLMFRELMAMDHSMLFIFGSEEPRSFWMKNTRVPLDILYFDAARRLVSLHSRVPPCPDGARCPSYASDGPAAYVLELNAGQAEALGLRRGDELQVGGIDSRGR
jgi:membrane fusion protein (multidrug efflux system)